VNALTGLGSGSAILNALLGTYQSTGDSKCIVESNGRAVFNYPEPNSILEGTLELLGLGGSLPAPRVIYLYGQNAGYYLETGYAGLGYLNQQTGAPFSLGTLDGTFVYGTTPPAASLASTDASGIFTANGAGQANYTLDENVDVGNTNLLELGVAGSGTYTLTDSTAGRFVLAPSTVIYAITPNSFVLLNTSATVTSPSIVLLQ
jgi:large repetitive protein